jgi:hypothetical protein
MLSAINPNTFMVDFLTSSKVARRSLFDSITFYYPSYLVLHAYLLTASSLHFSIFALLVSITLFESAIDLLKFLISAFAAAIYLSKLLKVFYKEESSN